MVLMQRLHERMKRRRKKITNFDNRFPISMDSDRWKRDMSHVSRKGIPVRVWKTMASRCCGETERMLISEDAAVRKDQTIPAMSFAQLANHCRQSLRGEVSVGQSGWGASLLDGRESVWWSRMSLRAWNSCCRRPRRKSGRLRA